MNLTEKEVDTTKSMDEMLTLAFKKMERYKKAQKLRSKNNRR